MDTANIERILRKDPVWSGYALADLSPTFAPHCNWTVASIDSASIDGTQAEGLVLFFDLLDPTAIVTVGDVAAVERAFEEALLPEKIYLNVREHHFPVVQRHYGFPNGTIGYKRMHLPLSQDSTAWQDDEQTVRLTPEDESRMRALYANGGPFTPDAFDTYQVENGIFFGIEDDAGALLAAGGTHIVAHEQRVAAIGNMYTHPDARGQGLAGQVLRSIVKTLRADGIELIILNVAQANAKAQRIYERHGFVVHCPYIEGVGVRKI